MLINHRLLLSLGAMLSLLSACSSGNTPQWMPRGYANQDDTPLSSPPLSFPWNANISTNLDDMGANSNAWQGAAFDLLDALSPNLIKDGEPLSLSPQTSSKEDRELDHYLRQALIKKGYTLTNQPITKNIIRCSVTKDNKKDGYNLTAIITEANGRRVTASSVKAALPFESQ